jgi:hypothetical protein
VLAEEVQCRTPLDSLQACDRCPSCVQVEAGTHPDFFTGVRPPEALEFPISLMRELCQSSRQPDWKPSLTAAWIRIAENLADVDARRPGVLTGQEQPQDARERLALVQLCLMRGQFVATARWYAEALAAQPKLADEVDTGYRFYAAIAAALAGCGQGKDTDKLDDKERAPAASGPGLAASRFGGVAFAPGERRETGRPYPA